MCERLSQGTFTCARTWRIALWTDDAWRKQHHHLFVFVVHRAISWESKTTVQKVTRWWVLGFDGAKRVLNLLGHWSILIAAKLPRCLYCPPVHWRHTGWWAQSTLHLPDFFEIPKEWPGLQCALDKLCNFVHMRSSSPASVELGEDNTTHVLHRRP